VRLTGKKLNRITYGLIGFVVLMLLIGWAMLKWRPSITDYPLQGVDVSHQYGDIAWPEVKAAGATFAYIKATEGAEMHDPAFARNWQETSRAGMQRGAYHYFSLCRLARDQAENFIATVPRDPNALPPAVEFDLAGNCEARPARDVLIAEVAVFISAVEAHSGKPVILHLNADFEKEYRLSESVDRGLWLRSMGVPPDFGARPWVMWQATAIRKVAGIDGFVNWNVVRK
jgi:lysozyme